jgi:UDP-2-acetamido-3-amino-2,3-dideoxy-glucuronate N-acetyltransferase
MSNLAYPGIAVIGAGQWGKNLVRNFYSLGALRIVCDTNVQSLAAVRAQYTDIRTTSSFSEVLEDPAVKGVVIATPAALHSALARQVLLADKDVLVEKPLALTEADGRATVQLAEQRGRVLMVGHLLWYHPAILKLKDLISQGELGRLQYVYSQRLSLGRVRREENILWSFAPHDISVMLGLVGETPDRVQVQGGYYLHQQIADVTVTCLTFPSGVSGHVFVSWLHPYKEQKLIVVGDRKMAVFNDLEQENKLVLYPHGIEWQGYAPVTVPKEAEIIPVEALEPLRAECVHFLDCVSSRANPRTNGQEALGVLKVLQQCQDILALDRNRTGPRSADTSNPANDVFIHRTATVDQGAQIGAGSLVWHYCHVMDGASIGQKCILGQNVFVGKGAVIGNNVKVQNNVSIYAGVVLEDGVFCGPSMVFTNVMNPRSEIERKDKFLSTRVKRGATIGANSTIVCGLTIGQYAFIGAGAVVVKDVPDFALVVGNPGSIIGWMCECGNRIHFAEGSMLGVCRQCHREYRKIREKVAPEQKNTAVSPGSQPPSK